ncbi:hypothetical protein B0H14DRAFT_3424012 [Mycena olivaceomarginata]|nr:hypothetical protein B0H14DRAFT_3424012 [Mycena olivaceomarginata]
MRGAAHQDQTASDEELANDPDAEENEEEEEDELADDTTVTTVTSPLKTPASKGNVRPPSHCAPARGAVHEDQTASDEERANDPDAEENEEEEKDELADTTVTLPLKVGPLPKGAKKIGGEGAKGQGKGGRVGGRAASAGKCAACAPKQRHAARAPKQQCAACRVVATCAPNNNTLPEPLKNNVPPVDDNTLSEPPKGNTTPPNNTNTSSKSSENNSSLSYPFAKQVGRSPGSFREISGACPRSRGGAGGSFGGLTPTLGRASTPSRAIIASNPPCRQAAEQPQ